MHGSKGKDAVRDRTHNSEFIGRNVTGINSDDCGHMCQHDIACSKKAPDGSDITQSNLVHRENISKQWDKFPFRIGWYGKPGNESDMLNLTEEHITFLKNIRPYTRRFRNVTANTSGLFEGDNESYLTSKELFHKRITQHKLYDSHDPVIDEVLNHLHTSPIKAIEQHSGGTQFKLMFHLDDGSKAMFKPTRVLRSAETPSDLYYWLDYERSTAEISAFHLDRILGFNRVPPTVGRIVNITCDIRRTADEDLEKSFFLSPVGNVCFYGECDYYCNMQHSICGDGEMLEGSMMAYLPSLAEFPRQVWVHPWKRSYNARSIKLARWERKPNYCAKIRRRPSYNKGRRLLDVMDIAVFDFLQGNRDRHSYELFTEFGNFTNILHLDNGKALGSPRFDDLSILAPVSQCCLIRYTTFVKLLHFNEGPLKLSEAMRASLNKDPVAPILLDKHFAAFDRRVRIILKTIYNCASKSKTPYKAIIDDGF